MASKSKWKQPEWADSVLEDTGASFLHEKKRHLGKYNRKRNSKVSKRKSISHNKASNKSAVRSQTKTKSTATKHQKDKPDNIISDKKSQDASCQLNTQTQKSMMIKRRPLSIQTQQILSLLSNAIDANKTKYRVLSKTLNMKVLSTLTLYQSLKAHLSMYIFRHYTKMVEMILQDLE